MTAGHSFKDIINSELTAYLDKVLAIGRGLIDGEQCLHLLSTLLHIYHIPPTDCILILLHSEMVI
jgi:hypothetical protein